MTWLILTLLGATASLVFTLRKMDRTFAAYRADTDCRLTDCENGATWFIPRVHALSPEGPLCTGQPAGRVDRPVETKRAL